MLFVMLVGAWLLIQQQCCSVSGDPSSRFRSATLVDPLMRRSPLEKNFMRFGRSSSSTSVKDVSLKDDLTLYGQSLDSLAMFDDFSKTEDVSPLSSRSNESEETVFNKSQSTGPRMRRAKENFMRFGKSDSDAKSVLSDYEKFLGHNYLMRLYKNKDEISDPVLSSPLLEPDFLRKSRAKDNFMRFGRDKERVVRNEKGKQDSFIRFGKSDNFGEDNDCDQSVEKIQTRDIDTGFLRFGRGKEKFMRFGKSKDDDLYPSEVVNKDRILMQMARNQDGIVRSTRQLQQEKSQSFIRFGRNVRLKRELNRNKEPLHQLPEPARNGHHDRDLGACKSSNVDVKNPIGKIVECNNNSCRPLYVPWPVYYQPSLYSVLPNVLTSSQVSLIHMPHSLHKPKRSRANNFIRLG